MRALRFAPALGLLIAFHPVRLQAQQARTPFTAEDALAITTYAVADVTDDGRYLAVTGTLRRDSFGQDFRRDVRRGRDGWYWYQNGRRYTRPFSQWNYRNGWFYRLY